MKVIKRNGRTEELDVSKIKKYTSEAVEGLENVSLSELEVDAKIQFRDMITTEEIQQTLIKTAVEKIDVDRPNWTFVAARLFLYDLYHKVTGFSGKIRINTTIVDFLSPYDSLRDFGPMVEVYADQFVKKDGNGVKMEFRYDKASNSFDLNGKLIPLPSKF